jgi:hypothetical protein
MPTKSNSYHADLTLNMFILACLRGLFGSRLARDVFTSGSLSHDPVVSKQAVFVSVSREDEVLVDKPLKSKDLNEKLQTLCIEVGIAGKNSIIPNKR